jgi:hypothetical protein
LGALLLQRHTLRIVISRKEAKRERGEGTVEAELSRGERLEA